MTPIEIMFATQAALRETFDSAVNNKNKAFSKQFTNPDFDLKNNFSDWLEHRPTRSASRSELSQERAEIRG